MRPSLRLRLVHKRKLYKCPSCGAEVPDLPMAVLKHQMSHVGRRPYSRSVPMPAEREPRDAAAASDQQRHPLDGNEAPPGADRAALFASDAASAASGGE